MNIRLINNKMMQMANHLKQVFLRTRPFLRVPAAPTTFHYMTLMRQQQQSLLLRPMLTSMPMRAFFLH